MVTTIIWYPKVGVKHTWQVYVTSELKIKLFTFFILSTNVWIFIGMKNRYLSIDCTKICNNSKQTKTSRNEVMQPTTSHNHSWPIVPKPCPQLGRFWQACYKRKWLYLLGYFENGFYFREVRKLISDYTHIILGSRKSGD